MCIFDIENKTLLYQINYRFKCIFVSSHYCQSFSSLVNTISTNNNSYKGYNIDCMGLKVMKRMSKIRDSIFNKMIM